MNNAKSQLGQDLWVLKKTNYKRNGFFIEAGACDGTLMSNTYLLEKDYNWNGICCEPNRDFHVDLSKNRSCRIEKCMLYDESNKVKEFHKAREGGGTLEDFKAEEGRLAERTRFPVDDYPTISLNDLLIKHNAPTNIDYISLDTEGSELKILSTFDFDKWDVGIWTVEHNTGARYDGGKYRASICELMSNRGYKSEQNKWDIYFFKDV